MNMNDNWVIVWKNLGIREEYTDQLEFELFYLDPLVEQLRGLKQAALSIARDIMMQSMR